MIDNLRAMVLRVWQISTDNLRLCADLGGLVLHAWATPSLCIILRKRHRDSDLPTSEPGCTLSQQETAQPNILQACFSKGDDPCTRGDVR